MTFNSLSAFAQSNDSDLGSFSKSETDMIKSFDSEKDVTSRKNKLNKAIKESKNTKYKNYLEQKVLVETAKSLESDKTNFVSKYENNSKSYSCWYGTGSEQGYNSFGGMLWKFNLRINACADASRVWSGSVQTTWADVFYAGWGYYGETNDRKFAYFGPGYLEYIASRQGLFKACISNNYACVQESRPWVEYHATREGFADYWY